MRGIEDGRIKRLAEKNGRIQEILKSGEHKNDDFRHQIFILKYNGRKIADILAMDKNIELALPDFHENAREIDIL